jgi:CRISPR-associated protein Csh1
VQQIFLGRPISKQFLFERIMGLIRKRYNESKTQDFIKEPISWTVLKAIMLLNYLQELNIIEINKNYNNMDTVTEEKKPKSFNLEKFNEFVNQNRGSFFNSDIKVGIFAVGIFVRYLFDIQLRELHTDKAPFENRLRGYKLDPDHLIVIYIEAVDKIHKYLKKTYVYENLIDVITENFMVRKEDMYNMSNNELSFYFVAGIEMGGKFKIKKDKKENESDNELE